MRAATVGRGLLDVACGSRRTSTAQRSGHSIKVEAWAELIGAGREQRPAMSEADEDTIICIFTPTQKSSPSQGRRQQTPGHTRSPGTPESPVPGGGKASGQTTGANGARMLMLSTAALAASVRRSTRTRYNSYMPRC